MCLSKVTTRFDSVQRGWKFFKVDNDGNLFFPYFGLPGAQGFHAERGKWLTAIQQPNSLAPKERRYTTGFHIFLSREEAKLYGKSDFSSYTYKIVTVMYKMPLALGTQRCGREQRDLNCVVASQMFIPLPRRKAVTA